MKKEKGKIIITCYDNCECISEISGSKLDLIAAIGGLIDDENKNNTFREMLFTAMEVVKFKNVIGQLEEISEEISEKSSS